MGDAFATEYQPQTFYQFSFLIALYGWGLHGVKGEGGGGKIPRRRAEKSIFSGIATAEVHNYWAEFDRKHEEVVLMDAVDSPAIQDDTAAADLLSSADS